MVLDAGPTAAGLLARPQLVIVGDGPQRARLEALVSRLGLRDNVRLTGAIGRPQVITELRRAQVFALPVRTRLGGLNPEGLGLAAIEAAACGLPVVVGDSGGAPETVRDGETGFVVPAGDHRDTRRQDLRTARRSRWRSGDGSTRAGIRQRAVRC